MKLDQEKHPVGTRFIMFSSESLWEATVQEWSSAGHVKIQYSYGQCSWISADKLPNIDQAWPPEVTCKTTTLWTGIKNFFCKR